MSKEDDLSAYYKKRDDLTKAASQKGSYDSEYFYFPESYTKTDTKNKPTTIKPNVKSDKVYSSKKTKK